MSRPTFLQATAVAFALALAGGALYALLTLYVSPVIATRAIVVLLGLAAATWLLATSPRRTGRFTAAVAWSVAAVIATAVTSTVTPLLAAHVVLLSMLRSLYFHSSLLAALADLGLSLLATAAFVWAAVQTGSAFLAIWSFFLVSALFVAIPARLAPRDRGDDAAAFWRARRSAAAALDRLSRGSVS